MNISYFKDLIQCGFTPIPIIRDESAAKEVVHLVNHSNLTPGNVPIDEWFDKIDKANGIALKLSAPHAMIDWDLKNTQRKGLFDEWLNIIKSTNEDVLRKVCIETTRNKGYHVYIKSPKATHKIQLAASETGAEVAALYTGGLLSYCYPTPGYKLIHNSFEDVEELTDQEFELLTTTAALFNEYNEPSTGEAVVITYPQQYESMCLTFDNEITDDAFERLLNEMTLYEVKDFAYGKRHKFTAYVRKGSQANYSAKVYFKSRKVLLFTTSIAGFPSWSSRVSDDDKSWVLTPTKILYYRNGRDWIKTIEEMQMIADAIGITLNHEPIAESNQQFDRMRFPYDIFPESLQNYIAHLRIQHEYVAGFFLPAITTAIGNTCYLQASHNYRVNPSIYLAVVAFAGGGKSPAMKVAFDFLQKYDNEHFSEYRSRLTAYNEQLNLLDKKKEKPIKPILKQTLINDATIETVINILQHNNKGCCLYADELSGFMKRMSQYKDGDDSQKWLEMWSGSPVMQQRITSDDRKTFDYTISIAGGIQPGIINALAKGDNAYNGFYHRFLFVFPQPDDKLPFESVVIPDELKQAVDDMFTKLMVYRDNETKDKYTLSDEAYRLYKQWHDYKNLYYNRTPDENAKGIISKYQDYCLRFALILQCLEDLDHRTGVISQGVMDRAIRLTEYFLGNMLKTLKILQPETGSDQVDPKYKGWYDELPRKFSLQTAYEIGKRNRLNEGQIRMFIKRNGSLFEKLERGSYEKI